MVLAAPLLVIVKSFPVRSRSWISLVISKSASLIREARSTTWFPPSSKVIVRFVPERTADCNA